MTVEVRYLGHFGNNLFEYALGRILAEELGLAMRCVPASDPPGWSNVEKASGIVDRLSNCYEQFADVPQTIAGRRVEAPQLRYVMGRSGAGQGMASILITCCDMVVTSISYCTAISNVPNTITLTKTAFAVGTTSETRKQQ